MNLAIHTPGQDSGARAVERVGFDMLRAILAARQAGSATVRALSAAQAPAHDLPGHDPQTTTMALLSGRRSTAESGQYPDRATTMGGAFSVRCASGHPVGNEGELHG